MCLAYEFATMNERTASTQCASSLEETRFKYWNRQEDSFFPSFFRDVITSTRRLLFIYYYDY